MGADRRGAPAAAPSGAAVLGSRSARRQVGCVLAAAAEAGAYSVGFTLARGSLTGFTIYYSGDSSGGAERRRHGLTRTCWAASAPTTRNAAADSAARPPLAGEQVVSAATCADAPAMASLAPATAARRRRGCRGGAKHKKRNEAEHKAAAASAAKPAGACAAADAAADYHDVDMMLSVPSKCEHPVLRLGPWVGPRVPSAANTPSSSSSSRPFNPHAATFYPKVDRKRVRSEGLGMPHVG